MPFNSFYIFLSKYFGLKKNTEEAHYLKELLRLSFTLKVGETEPANMTYDNFRVICRLFKINQERDKGFIERMIEVFRSDWFYGYVDREDAQKQLDALAISKKRKTHLQTILCGLLIPRNCVLHLKRRMELGKMQILSLMLLWNIVVISAM